MFNWSRTTTRSASNQMKTLPSPKRPSQPVTARTSLRRNRLKISMTGPIIWLKRTLSLGSRRNRSWARVFRWRIRIGRMWAVCRWLLLLMIAGLPSRMGRSLRIRRWLWGIISWRTWSTRSRSPWVLRTFLNAWKPINWHKTYTRKAPSFTSPRVTFMMAKRREAINRSRH